MASTLAIRPFKLPALPIPAKAAITQPQIQGRDAIWNNCYLKECIDPWPIGTGVRE
jgi:hypothetical protein